MSSPSTTSTLIARIPYLNTEPFYRRFSARGYELVNLVPRRLGEEAARGRVVAGVMSLVDWIRQEAEFEPLGPYGIACAGPVLSVALFSSRPVPELTGRTVAVTRESSTSVKLLEVLFRHHYDVHPAEWRLGTGEPADAELLIGDPALRAQAARRDPVVLDLAQAWWEWQRLPFVFALWVVKRSLPLEEKKVLALRLEDALYEGLKEIPAIAAERAADLGLPAEALEKYLRHFRYRFGPDDWAGIDEFRRLLDRDHGTR